MRVGLYNRWLSTLGGGEIHSISLALALAQYGAQITVFGPDCGGAEAIYERLGLDVTGLRFCLLNSVSEDELAEISEPFDLFVHCSITRMPPVLRAKRSVALVFFPCRPADDESEVFRRRIRGYHAVWTNSKFTAEWIGNYWDTTAQVLHPPITTRIEQVSHKRNAILSVGRYFVGGHEKRHDILLHAFEQFAKHTRWQLYFVGGLGRNERDLEYFHNLSARCLGSDVHLLANLPRTGLEELYRSCAFFWHATGYGVVESDAPERCEHFGIATVEAMAGGCIPFVVPSGGQRDVVTHLENGLHWRTVDELVQLTENMAHDVSLQTQLKEAASLRALDFEFEKFTHRVGQLLNEIAT